MFNNIGKKIKLLAKFGCWVGIICCVITGIIFLALIGEDWIFIIPGLITLIAGPVIMWIASWLTYSWGDLIENVQSIKNNICNDEPLSTPNKTSKNKQKLDALLSSGLINQEEYNKALEKENLC